MPASGSAIFLFTGPNSFALYEEARAWRRQFMEKHGSENHIRLEGKSLTFRSLLDEISTAPFLAEKRLVMIEGIPRFIKEEMERLPAVMHPATVLVFLEPQPDKRLGSVKALLQQATVKEFPQLSASALSAWIQHQASAGLEPSAQKLLLETVGADQSMLAAEMQKLSAYAKSRPITADDVRRLAVPSGEQEVWRMMQLLSQGDHRSALQYLEALLRQGEDPVSLWNMLLWMLRSLVSVAATVREGERNPAKIASLSGVPFPTVRTLLPVAQSFDQQSLRRLVDFAASADIDLKTGNYRSTGEAPEEMIALLQTFVLEWTSAMGKSNAL